MQNEQSCEKCSTRIGRNRKKKQKAQKKQEKRAKITKKESTDENLQKEYEKIENLKVKKEEEVTKWDEQNSALVQAHEAYVKEAETRLEKETQLLKGRIAQLESEIVTEKEISEEIQRQVEEDADEEIENLKKVFQQNIESERIRQAELRIEHAKTRKSKESATRNEMNAIEEASLAKNDLVSYKLELERTKQAMVDKDEEIRRLNDENKRAKDEATRKAKEEKKIIANMNELTLKFCKIDQEILPSKDLEICELKKSLKDMEASAIKTLETVKTFQRDLDEANRNVKTSQKDAKLKRRQCEQSENVVKRFQRDLFQVVDRMEDFKALKDSVVFLYARYAREEESKENEKFLTRAEETAQAAQKRNEVLEQTIERLRKQLRKESEARRAEVAMVLRENADLCLERNRKTTSVVPSTTTSPFFSELKSYINSI